MDGWIDEERKAIHIHHTCYSCINSTNILVHTLLWHSKCIYIKNTAYEETVN